MHYSIEVFEEFLQSIDLNNYRLKYSPIKTVEMDLDKNIQALKSMYEIYWDKDNTRENIPLSFEKYYEYYFNTNKEKIINFREKVRFGSECDCFRKGLEARIYRTWASLITQIHAAYVAESVFGEGNVCMNDDLDHKGIDFQINEFGIQIKKASMRRDARVGPITNKKSSMPIFSLFYPVPSANDIENPHYQKNTKQAKKGELKPILKDFIGYDIYGENKYRLLKNRFVVFTKQAFEDFSDGEKLKIMIEEYNNGE